MRSALFSLLAFLLLLLTPAVRAEEKREFADVEVQELKDNPQRYWAQGIVFRDVLLPLPKKLRAETMGERKVIRFETKVLGECYLDERLKSVLQDMASDQEYIFSGTVYQQKRHFYVVVSKLTAALKNMASQEALSDQIAALQTGKSQTAQQLDFLLTTVQSDLLGYADAENLEVPVLFDGGDAHRDRVLQAVRTGITRLEEESHAPSSEFLIQLIYSLLQQRYGITGEAPAATAAPAEGSATQPAPEAVEPEKAPQPDVLVPEHTEPPMESGEAMPALQEEAPAPEPAAESAPAADVPTAPEEAPATVPENLPDLQVEPPEAPAATEATEQPPVAEPVPVEPAAEEKAAAESAREPAVVPAEAPAAQAMESEPSMAPAEESAADAGSVTSVVPAQAEAEAEVPAAAPKPAAPSRFDQPVPR